MNQELDKYLLDVESELCGLEPQQCASELREIQQHLEASVAWRVEDGQSYEAAVAAATAQFGTARAVGRQLQQANSGREAWWRIGAAPLAGASAFLLGWKLLLDPLAEALKAWVPMSSLLFPTFLFAGSWSLCVAAGSVAAWLSPRWGARLLLGVLVIALVASVRSCGVVTGVDYLTLLVGSVGILAGSRGAKRRLPKSTSWANF
jgi:hypothetical protein